MIILLELPWKNVQTMGAVGDGGVDMGQSHRGQGDPLPTCLMPWHCQMFLQGAEGDQYKRAKL